MSIKLDIQNHGFNRYLEKIAGGPGSGVKGYNTATHPLPKSKHISVGTRKGMLDHMPYKEGKVKVNDVTHSCQDKFVPEKIQKFLKNPDWIRNNQVDILVIPEEEIIITDGNHRLIAAKQLGMADVPAKIYTSRKGEPANQDS